MAAPSRESLIPVVGLLGLLGVGALMLYNTTGGDPSKDPSAQVKKAKKPKKAKKQPKRPKVELVHKGEVGDRPAAPAGARNLVLITGCSIRRDALSPYGADPRVTPRLDALAKAGARFDDALAAGAWTRESVGAMLTGRHAVEVGLVDPRPRMSNRKLDDGYQTATEALAEQGWWTVGVNAIPGISRNDSNLWQGIDHIRDAHPQGLKPQLRLGDAQAADLAIGMLEERPADRPFFLHIALADSHKPLKLGPKEADAFTAAGLPSPGYLAAVHHADLAVGAVMDWLEAQKLAEQTYVVFVADHGEGLDRPKHLGPAHGRYLGQNVIRIPWIVGGPGISAGSVVGGLASGVDVGPTLLGLLGVKGLEGASGRDLSGSLTAGTPTGRDAVISDSWFLNANRAAIWTAKTQCQRDFGSTNAEKDGFVDGCFDRVRDPDFESAAPVDSDLMAQLVAWRAEREPGAVPPQEGP